MAKCSPDGPVEKYRRYLEGTGAFSHHTVDNYLYDVQHLERWLKRRRRNLLEARDADLRAYLESLNSTLAPSSLARRISGVGRFFRYAERRGWMRSNPAAMLQRPRVTPVEMPVATEDEVMGLLEDDSDKSLLGLRTTAALELLYGAGVRIAELAAMDVEHLDTRARMLRVRGKGGKERLCPVNSTALRALARYHDARAAHLRERGRPEVPAPLFTTTQGKRLSVRQLRFSIKDAAAAHGLMLTPHDFRRAYATHLLNRGARIEDLSDLMGHARLSTTQRYARVYPETVRRTYARSHPRAHKLQAQCRQARCEGLATVQLQRRVAMRVTPGPCAEEGWRPDTRRRGARKARRIQQRNAPPVHLSS
jgi:integrase/recombinase XerC